MEAAEDGQRVAGGLRAIAADHPGGTVAVVGRVAGLTVELNVLCGRVWGAPLPHAVPVPIETDGGRWWCRSWPGETQNG